MLEGPRGDELLEDLGWVGVRRTIEPSTASWRRRSLNSFEE